MTILWCGGEDVDFPYGIFTIPTNRHRTTYGARCAIVPTDYAKSLPLTTPVSSCWLSAYLFNTGNNSNQLQIGLGKYGYTSFIGIGGGSPENKLTLFKYDGALSSLSAQEVANYTTWSFHRVDICIESYAVNGRVKVYLNGNLEIDYQGDVTVLGQTTLDQVCLYPGYQTAYSEMILADQDTRLLNLAVLAPNAAGDTSTNWTGAYTDIDETAISDSDKIYSSTNDADFQANLTGMPSGTWSVKAVKIAARCVDGSGATGIQLGVKSGGTVASGDTQTASGYWQTKERLMQVNPVTGVAFTPAEIDALQVNLRAKAL